MSRTYIKIGVRTTLIVGVVALLVYALGVRGSSVGATFATGSGTGGLEMKIDSRTIYNGVLQPALSWALKDLTPWADHFFNFGDVKPGDHGTNTISIHIKKNPAWVCLDFVNLKDKENGKNEPESQVDGTSDGELSHELEFFSWMDDGDNKYEIGERALFGTSTQSAFEVLKGKSYALADAHTGTAFPAGQTKYVGVVWCAGDLSVSTTTASIACNGEAMGNEAQTDSMSLDVALRAVSSKDQKRFSCTNDTPEPALCLARGNLLKNGSFEKPKVGRAKWDVFPSVVGGLEWTVAWVTPATNSPTVPLLELQRGLPAFEGKQFAELDSDFYGPPGGNYKGEKTSVAISQLVDTTPGARYTLTFAFSPLPKTNAADNAVQAVIGGVAHGAPISRNGSALTTTSWTEHTFSFVATSTKTRVALVDVGKTTSFGTLVDDVWFGCKNQREDDADDHNDHNDDYDTPWHEEHTRGGWTSVVGYCKELWDDIKGKGKRV